jgi:hypothetical protein
MKYNLPELLNFSLLAGGHALPVAPGHVGANRAHARIYLQLLQIPVPFCIKVPQILQASKSSTRGL